MGDCCCISREALAPDFLGDLFDQRQFCPLFLLSELIPNFARREATLRAEGQAVQRNVPGCLMDTGNHSLFILQLGRFCGNQSQNNFLVTRDFFQRRKASGALIVKFQIISIDIFLPEDQRCNLVISACAGPSGMEVAAADMGIDDQIIGFAFDGQIINC